MAKKSEAYKFPTPAQIRALNARIGAVEGRLLARVKERPDPPEIAKARALVTKHDSAVFKEANNARKKARDQAAALRRTILFMTPIQAHYAVEKFERQS